MSRRSKKYDPKYCDMLIEHGKQGLSYKTFAAVIGVSRRTLYDWESLYPEWKECKEMSFDSRELLYEKAYIAGMMGKMKVNAPMAIFGMKNICGWRDQTDMVIEQKPIPTISRFDLRPPEPGSPEEEAYRRMIAEKKQKKKDEEEKELAKLPQ